MCVNVCFVYKRLQLSATVISADCCGSLVSCLSVLCVVIVCIRYAFFFAVAFVPFLHGQPTTHIYMHDTKKRCD